VCVLWRWAEGATNILQAILLGITQAVTEFAPVSSSGHLILIPWIGHWGIQQTPSLRRSFGGVLQLGSFVGAVA
jgi:undecaprenyl-diphosphatase